MCRPVAVLAVLFVLSPALAAPQAVLGPEFQVNTYITNDQDFPSVATDADGNFAVVWQSRYQDGSVLGVFARFYDPSGAPFGPTDILVNSHTPNDQAQPRVAASASGEFVVVWTSFGQDGSTGGVFARRFDAAGNTLGPRVPGQRLHHRLAVRRGGGHGCGGQLRRRVARRRGGRLRGVGAAIQCRQRPGGRRFPRELLHLAERRAAVRGQGRQRGVHRHLAELRAGSRRLVRHLRAALQRPGDAGRSGVQGERLHHGPPVAAFGRLGRGWPLRRRLEQLWAGPELLRHLRPAVRRRGHASRRRVRHERDVADNQTRAQVARDPRGAFTVVWDSFSQDGSNYGVFGRHFDANGAPDGLDFLVNAHTTGSQMHPAIAANERGDFVVAWVPGPGWRRQRCLRPALPVRPDLPGRLRRRHARRLVRERDRRRRPRRVRRRRPELHHVGPARNGGRHRRALRRGGRPPTRTATARGSTSTPAASIRARRRGASARGSSSPFRRRPRDACSPSSCAASPASTACARACASTTTRRPRRRSFPSPPGRTSWSSTCAGRRHRGPTTGRSTGRSTARRGRPDRGQQPQRRGLRAPGSAQREGGRDGTIYWDEFESRRLGAIGP